MRKAIVLSSVLLIGIFSGCAPMPQSADEFRLIAPGSRMIAVETFEVSRPYADVAATFQKKADECLLDKKVVRTGCAGSIGAGRSCSSQEVTYNPTVIRGAEKTELYLQVEMTKSLSLSGRPPEGGPYIIVADVTPISHDRTQIVMISPKAGYFTFTPQAIKSWAHGTNLGCPDLTKDF